MQIGNPLGRQKLTQIRFDEERERERYVSLFLNVNISILMMMRIITSSVHFLQCGISSSSSSSSST